ncbi:MAG TPA: DUF4377 domain-containing protein [Chitinophagales bacterium]|nr:DUF4377 domain-containing protein [Chitinophagales bacterium]
MTTACTLDTSKSCLLVRENPNDRWQIFEDSITGFTHKKGTQYCLLVKVVDDKTKNKQRYVLEEIKSTSLTDTLAEIQKPQVTNSIFCGKKWMLYKLKTKNELKIFTIAKAILSFDLSSTHLKLTLDCAQYAGEFLSQNESLDFKNLNAITSTCKKRSVEDDLLKMLSLTNRYKIRKKELLLFKDDILLSVWLLKK